MKKLKNWKSYVFVLAAGILVGVFSFWGRKLEYKTKRTTSKPNDGFRTTKIRFGFDHHEISLRQSWPLWKFIEINNWSIPLTNKYFILTYEGEVNLGVDLDQADIQVTQNKIKIALPPVEVLTNTIDEKA